VKVVARDVDGTPEIVLSEVFSGIGIETAMGHFGIAQRDDGIEVMLNGKTVWTSHEVPNEPELYPREKVLAPNGPGIRLPDGSGAFVASWPLPKTHWLYAEGPNEPPMPMRVGLGAKRNELADQIKAAARHAIRASTMNGKETDFDPDAMVQNMVIGLLGYWTEDGRSGSCGEVGRRGE
jgi:hypothetical protein